MEIINIQDIKNQKLGGKALGLKKLLEYEMPVPEAFVIDYKFIELLINNNNRAINSLKHFVNYYEKNSKFAIRSSANNEDSNEISFAGIYESVLNVPLDLKEIIFAIEKVYRSIDSKRTKSYSNEKTNMNIIIQKMINPKIAGVCFTKAIDLNGEKVMLIEYVDGLGEKLVSGKAIGKTIIVNLNDMSYRSDENITEKVISELLKYLKHLINVSEQDLDIEWCIDHNNKVYFVQARPITRPILIRSKIFNGAIASPGFCKGKVYIIDEDAEEDEIEQKIEKFPKGAVLLAKTTDTNYVPAMKKASGIITTEGSILSHAAIISRELGIPCITGFKNAFDIFSEGNIIEFDTNTYKMKYNSETILFGDGKAINELELYLFDNIIEENINGNIVLVEKLENEFGIHIEEELKQDEIDEIEISIRKKYQKAPIILKDQKYLWYFEFKRFLKIPGFDNLVTESKKIIESFDANSINTFVENVCNITSKVASQSISNYDKIFAREYAQATHFLINLHMCNGLAMKKLIDIAKEQSFMSLKELLGSDNKKVNNFFNVIESIRKKIWGYYVQNKWSDKDYFDIREEDMKKALNYNGDDIVDYFYNNLSLKASLENIVIGNLELKKNLKLLPNFL